MDFSQGRFKNLLMRFIKGILTSTDLNTPTEKQSDSLISIVAGLTTSSMTPIPNCGDEVTHEYLKLYSAVGPLYEITLNIHGYHVVLPARSYEHVPAARAGWYAYLLLRFTLRPQKLNQLSQRLARVAAHHRVMRHDADNMYELLTLLRNTSIHNQLAYRCDWWNTICSHLSVSPSDIARSVVSKFTLLAQPDSVSAYRLFTQRGGHEGCLTNTGYLHLEPILYSSPAHCHGLYIATLHMLSEKIDDGSIFSEPDNATPTVYSPERVF